MRYRLTTGPWDYDNHGIIMFTRANGDWLWKQLIDRDLAGPFVSSGERRPKIPQRPAGGGYPPPRSTRSRY